MEKEYFSKVPIHQSPVWTNFEPELAHLDIELTERCNNNCTHCYVNLPAADPKAREKELTFREIRNILAQASSLGCLDICLTGGEPLLRDDFEDIYLFARKSGFRVLIVTNATLITPRLAELFQRVPPLQKISVSVYGMDCDAYESRTRVNGSFKAFEMGIQLLLDHQVPFIARPAMHPINADELRAFEFWAKKIPWMDTPVAPTSLLYLRARDGAEKRNQEIRKLRLRPKQLLAIEDRKFKDYRAGLKNFCVQLCRIPGDQLFKCGAGIRKASIDAYGNLQLCLMLRHPQTVFNLRKGTLSQGLTEFFPEVRKMTAKNPLYLKRCARCFLKNLCEQCPAVSWMENGALDGWPQYFCEFTHAQARLIGLLEKGECAWEIDDWKQRIEKTCRSTTVAEPACLAQAETIDVQTIHSQEDKT